jgi:hypothetical protein
MPTLLSQFTTPFRMVFDSYFRKGNAAPIVDSPSDLQEAIVAGSPQLQPNGSASSFSASGGN